MGCVSGNHSDCLWILSAPLPRCRHFISGGLAGVGALLLTHPLDGDMGGRDAKFFGFGHGSLNVPIEHHPTIRYMVYDGYYKLMSNIPKMGQLPTSVGLPDFF